MTPVPIRNRESEPIESMSAFLIASGPSEMVAVVRAPA
jgi:hypothetical protein